MDRSELERLNNMLLWARSSMRAAGVSPRSARSAELILVHVTPLLYEEGRWLGPSSHLQERCGRKERAVRRALRALEAGGVIRTARSGARGLEIHALNVLKETLQTLREGRVLDRQTTPA